MNRTLRSGLFVLLSLLVSVVILSGCGGGRRDDDEDFLPPRPRAQKKGDGPAATVSLKPVSATEHGVIRGKIKWEGGRPDLAGERELLQKSILGNSDRDYCLNSPGVQEYETDQQSFRIGKNELLGNVFVWIQPEPKHFFVIPQEQLDAIPKTVTLRQPHCAFLPHCFVLFPSYRGEDGKLTPSGQQFFIENDAKVGHNANVQGGPQQITENASIPAGGKPKLVALRPTNQEVKISCSIHLWMSAYARVFDHPYATVSSVGANLAENKWENLDSPEVGTYEIKGVPVGAKVRLFAWHERLGFIQPSGPKGKEIVLQKENEEDFVARMK